MFSHVDTRGRPKALADGTLNEKKKKKSLSKQNKKKGNVAGLIRSDSCDLLNVKEVR